VLEPRPPNVQLDPWLSNLQQMLKLKPALVIGEPSLCVLSLQSLPWVRRLGAEDPRRVAHSVLEPVALDLADALVPDARLRRLCGPLPQLLDYVYAGGSIRAAASA
jgi:hypothetical protein